jgi:hypothetical protein
LISTLEPQPSSPLPWTFTFFPFLFSLLPLSLHPGPSTLPFLQEHYVPVWKETPDDILEAIEWARTNDDEARRIAARGQKFAVR